MFALTPVVSEKLSAGSSGYSEPFVCALCLRHFRGLFHRREGSEKFEHLVVEFG